MRSSANGPRRIAAIAGVFALALAVAPVVSGDERSPLQIRSVRLDGDRLLITVTNTSDRTVHEKLVFANTALWVTLGGGQTTTLELRSPSGGEIGPLGVILDDGSPF